MKFSFTQNFLICKYYSKSDNETVTSKKDIFNRKSTLIAFVIIRTIKTMQV